MCPDVFDRSKPITETQLLVPENDATDPILSIVIPALNEEISISQFIDWCHEGIQAAGIAAEIIIIDSSNDRTPDIALAKGARVIRTPKRGLGQAYIDSLPFIRGKWLLLGDADCTYDFRKITPFIEKFQEGYEYIMGSRVKGSVEPGSRPPLHQYFGAPVTNWALNMIHGTHFSDIHCGMRGITLDAFRRMHLQSKGWSYAPEMVLKSVLLELKTTEVPIHFLKEPEGRISHLAQRGGWVEPWKAGWASLQVTFTYGASAFLLWPGILLALPGLLLMLLTALGSRQVGNVQLDLHFLFLGVSTFLIGSASMYMGILAKMVNDLHGRHIARWASVFTFNRSVKASAFTIMVGLVLDVLLVHRYVQNGYVLSSQDEQVSHLAIFGLGMIAIGCLTFGFTLLVNALIKRLQYRPI
ncbi:MULTISPECIES: glycosyltransferase family 2 protein [Nitrospirillum]|uniref:Glycosyl transferase family 2 n=1 Tax=Nitrospirillum viridazoti CBAmc TaxID=1441467 RepID=A0A248K1N7_9PROT|nr:MULTISPECIES: glycosyltransferase family 2 protein [Nitrospirillum]ASG24699.1 glycosyl transferase family 2 [Nitrospirillum amazonense CBAmc]MEA1672496.1 glycosyltransferase family 2 protein [Nitrospirillum sp. BR 11163]TWB44994.1 glycosyltransferase involved in cell wall biosynthesis [Nitrospirillum amazonense]